MSAIAALTDPERIKDVAFAITSTIEGGSYSMYQNYDSGIVSYGLFQFTLAAGSLESVLDLYLGKASGPTADGLRALMPRIEAKDPALREDAEFKALLIAAGKEQPMKDAQESVATEKYWNRAQQVSMQPRNIKSPLGQALFFDLSIHYGPFHSVANRAEDRLGIPHKTHLPTANVTEQQMISTMAQVRKEDHYAQAERDNLPGLKRRADLWVGLVEANDWYLEGDASGEILVFSKKVKVWNPSQGGSGGAKPSPDPIPVDDGARVKKAAYAISSKFQGNSDNFDKAWTLAQQIISSRGVKLPMGVALIFDLAILYGQTGLSTLVGGAEAALGGLPGKSLAANSISEVTFIGKLIADNKTALYRKAEQTGQGGWRNRADFWISLYAAEDGQLQGDASGNVKVLGVSVQVKNPA